ncbi:50S ribosomal protein L21 [Candidatus Woesebacteria bacterium RIFCSPHIGHO2_01_FULL_38_9b]|uniref:50S ribosomal protein L21 n=1 Tax=Candidatus Woesebacteria bacterium RIFCSPHIGHO2_01_FULL_38_9b TaxID=1802493 RepID=A0A1F7XZZ1_9BACT|nr:MAG: 50S ribosomal protein L21 [Candidatus Woesebacteria bacterium RIFCSPHIGHO2_01_FULL_38_9b]
MKKYAIVRIKGSQFKVSEEDEFLVGKMGDDKPKADILLIADEGKVKIGKPIVKGAEVKIKLVNAEEKGKKITVFKYKAKSRYRKKIGFRPQYSRLLVEKIG